MWLLADSGSTKTHWQLMDGRQAVARLETIGLNPNVLPEAEIRRATERELLPSLTRLLAGQWVERLYFYGSGCSDELALAHIKSAFEPMFPNAELHISHDLLGAARAAAGAEPALVAILGTGSSACIYNGREIVRARGTNGYLLADFGGGVDLGRKLLNRLLDADLPTEVGRAFRLAFQCTPQEYRFRVYHSPRPNYELAQLAPFVSDNRHEKTVYNIVEEAFRNFVERVAAPLHKSFQFDCFAVGSVAEAFRPMLEMVLRDANIPLRKVLGNPLDGLVDFHLRAENPA